MRPRCDAVLMIGFGGPTAPEEVRPFLDGVLRGRPVPRERYEEVIRHYEAIGGRSPYNELTTKQAVALRTALWRDGPRIPVHLGMRNWQPYLRDAIHEIARGGARRILGFVLAPHRCEASWERYQATVREALDELGADAPAIDYPEPWHAHPLFIEAMADRTAAAIAQLSAAQRPSAQLIFTAHSIPAAMAAASRYAPEVEESARLVARSLGRSAWSVAYQSRSGDPREAWLEPDIGSALRSLRGRPAVVVPIGFICDHLEVLYDLDIEAAAIAQGNGIHMVRAQTVGDHPRFIEMMAAIIRHHAGA
jgi:ferrochelatase